MRMLFALVTACVFVINLYFNFAFASSYQQIQVIKKVMPAVVGIGIDRRLRNIGYGFAGNRAYDALSRYFEEYLKEFQKRMRHNWQEKNINPEDIDVIGSGFFIDEQGTLLTAYHVVSNMQQFFILTHDNKVYRAKVIRTSEKDDVAVLRVRTSKKVKFPCFELGDSSQVEVGEPVLAIGNPFGFTFTVTSGIISALNRSTGRVSGLLQTDASINPGNSGGPLINMDGQVIGINHAILNPTRQKVFIGLGFAVPINKVKSLLASGAKKKPWLGIQVDGRGFELRVRQVAEGSPAFQAGIKSGDIIISVNGKKFTSVIEMAKYIQNFSPGEQLCLEILRRGNELKINVILGEK